MGLTYQDYYGDPWVDSDGGGDTLEELAAWELALMNQDPTVTTLSGPHTTVAQVTYGSLTAAGDAKRNKGERTQEQVGRDLAVGRAFIELGNRLIDRAYNLLED